MSPNIFILSCDLWNRMQTKNRNGPRRDPWGKPHTKRFSLSSESGRVLKDTTQIANIATLVLFPTCSLGWA